MRFFKIEGGLGFYFLGSIGKGDEFFLWYRYINGYGWGYKC